MTHRLYGLSVTEQEMVKCARGRAMITLREFGIRHIEDLAVLLGLSPHRIREIVFGRVYGLTQRELEPLAQLRGPHGEAPPWHVFLHARICLSSIALFREAGVRFKEGLASKSVFKFHQLSFLLFRGVEGLVVASDSEEAQRIVGYPLRPMPDEFLLRQEFSGCELGLGVLSESVLRLDLAAGEIREKGMIVFRRASAGELDAVWVSDKP